MHRAKDGATCAFRSWSLQADRRNASYSFPREFGFGELNYAEIPNRRLGSMVLLGWDAKGCPHRVFGRRQLLPQSYFVLSRRRACVIAWRASPNHLVELDELKGFGLRFFAGQRLTEGVFPALDEIVDAVVRDLHRLSIADVWRRRTAPPFARVAKGGAVRGLGICEMIVPDAYR